MRSEAANLRPVSLMRSRPAWDRQWKSAKMGSISIQRRHCIRSGLMQEAFLEVIRHCKQTANQDELRHGLLRILDQANVIDENQSLKMETLTHLVLSRLHNNHANIFIGIGWYNSSIGKLSHALGYHEKKFIDHINESSSIDRLRSEVSRWQKEVISFAICQYHHLDQIKKIDIANKVEAFFHSHLSDNELFTSMLSTGIFENITNPMNRLVYEKTIKSIIEFALLMKKRTEMITSQVDSGYLSLLAAKKELVEFAISLQDTADFDISESSSDKVRIIQNSLLMKISQRFSEILENPSLEKFEMSVSDFLTVEEQLASALDLEPDFHQWFQNRPSREQFIDAIQSDNMPRSLENSRYNPRQFKPQILEHMKESKDHLRLQMVPSSLVRRAGYIISDHAFAKGKEERLAKLYERIFSLSEKIPSIQVLQKCHADVIHEVHNMPTNIFIGHRGYHTARENLLFALETEHSGLQRDLEQGQAIPEVWKACQKWLVSISHRSLSRYLALAPNEDQLLKQAISNTPTDVFRTKKFYQQIYQLLPISDKNNQLKLSRKSDKNGVFLILDHIRNLAINLHQLQQKGSVDLENWKKNILDLSLSGRQMSAAPASEANDQTIRVMQNQLLPLAKKFYMICFPEHYQLDSENLLSLYEDSMLELMSKKDSWKTVESTLAKWGARVFHQNHLH